jgi:hypothetical protein
MGKKPTLVAAIPSLTFFNGACVLAPEYDNVTALAQIQKTKRNRRYRLCENIEPPPI